MKQTAYYSTYSKDELYDTGVICLWFWALQSAAKLIDLCKYWPIFWRVYLMILTDDERICEYGELNVVENGFFFTYCPLYYDLWQTLFLKVCFSSLDLILFEAGIQIKTLTENWIFCIFCSKSWCGRRTHGQ